MKVKIDIIKKLLIASTILIVGYSCSDWFDVRPKSQILAEEHFSKENGYTDQLTGIYTNMSDTAFYGKQMTFGLMDVLAQIYDLNISNNYVPAAEYNYQNRSIKSVITNIWSKSYNTIANINLMLDYIDKVDQNIFTDNNYYIYKGEALGLRAYLHFDMLRVFAPSYHSNPSAQAIPYVDSYSTNVTSISTVSQVLDYIIDDLNDALVLLEKDPLYTVISDSAYYIRNDKVQRASRFNYYAAKATLARAYQWKGDLENARIHAEDVIIDDKFSWIHYTTITSANAYERDLTFSSEHIFRLNINKFDEIVNSFFKSNAGVQVLSPSEAKMDEIFEISTNALGNDYRYYYHFANSYDGEARYLSKFWQYDNSKYINMLPLIRLSEMYYIAAEAYVNTNPAKAIELLNEVRDNRGLSSNPLSTDLSAPEITNEIYKEYRKEFLGEGQLFYYYKRLGYTTIPGSSVNASDAIYALPLPDNELEFRN